MNVRSTLPQAPVEGALIPSFAIDPDVPRDPLAAADASGWASARRYAVLGLEVDERVRQMLASLERLDDLLRALEEGGADTVPATLIDESDLLADDVPIELSVDELSDVEQVDTVAAFVAAGTRPREQMASAETIVLHGPDIRRKIRSKQSVMPSYMAQVLYEDIGVLFALGDREGALISLERMLTVAPVSQQAEAFLTHNEDRLVDYYESSFGPFTRTATLLRPEHGMPNSYFEFDKVAAVAGLLDGERTLGDVIAASGLRPIEACAVISQLHRTSSLDFGDKAEG